MVGDVLLKVGLDAGSTPAISTELYLQLSLTRRVSTVVLHGRNGDALVLTADK
jgi:hypothetical protein